MASRSALAAGLPATLLLSLLPAHARAQSCPSTFGPVGPDIRPSQNVSWDQVWSQVARGPSEWMISWSAGQDIFARRFDLGFAPLGAEFQVNTVYALGQQDEPAICYGGAGTYLVAWSERFGYDGSQMSCFARVYDTNGAPVTGEFLVNQTTNASQWRPLIAPTPGGGFVVAWTGDWDGNSFFRVLASNGAFLTGEVQANTYVFDAQVDPSAAVAPDGTVFVAFVDFSSHGGVGTGLNLWGRTFDSAGNPLTAEFVLTTFTSNSDQRDPRVAADANNRFIVAYESQQGDGSGYGIFARAFGSNGSALAPEFQVNSTTTGNQRSPRVAVDQQGRSLFVWEDDSAGVANSTIRARRFDAQLVPLGVDSVVHTNPAGGTMLPSVAMDPTGSDVAIGYEGPGLPGNGQDVYARRFAHTPGPHVYCTAKVNSLGCLPAIASSGSPSATLAEPFLITAGNLRNQKVGLLLYGYGSAFTPFQGATICIATPFKRTPSQSTGGSPVGTSDCTGTLSMDFNARIQSGIDAALVSGATVSARWYARDPADPAGFGTSLTDALRFVICP